MTGKSIMMNNDGGAGEVGQELRRAVARVYGWPASLPPTLHPTERPAADLEACAGRYQRSPDEVIAFRREGTHFVENINGGLDILAYPVGGDTLAFTDFPLKGVFERAADGGITGFRMQGAAQAMPRLRPNELLPNELLRLGRVAEAVIGYRSQQLSEYQLTYMAYELLNRRPTPDLAGAEGLLQLAREQFPASGIVAARWGDLSARRGEKSQAMAAYQAARRQNPTDKELQEKLAKLAP